MTDNLVENFLESYESYENSFSKTNTPITSLTYLSSLSREFVDISQILTFKYRIMKQRKFISRQKIHNKHSNIGEFMSD